MTWNSAFRHLQNGLTAAQSSGAAEVRVAQGTHRPDESSVAPNGNGSRTTRFKLLPNVAICGGFAGLQGRDPDARDIDGTPTILSGDLLGNDSGAPATMGDNSFTIIDGGGVDANARIDGFLVTGANGAASMVGGGMTITTGTGPTVVRCHFYANRSGKGGGVGVDNAQINSHFDRCRFTANVATTQGGAMMVLPGADIWFENCIFTGNSAESFGALAAISLVEGCVFYANVSTSAVAVVGVGPLMRNSIVWGNSAGGSTSLASQLIVQWPEYCLIENFILDPFGSDESDRPEGSSGAWPAWISVNGADGIAGTFDDDFHLAEHSPAIDAGSPWKNSADGTTDIDGEPRLQSCRTDIGPDERPGWGIDCNGDQISDACQIAAGELADCDLDGVPDICAIAAGAADCDASGSLDVCDTSLPVTVEIGPFGPAGQGYNWSTSIADLPRAATVVRGTIFVKVPWHATPLTISMGGSFQTHEIPDSPFFGPLLYADCPEFPDVAVFEMSAASFNDAIQDGMLEANLSFGGTQIGVDPCGGTSFVSIHLDYRTTDLTLDCNGNGNPDSCDIASGLSADINRDGVPDECQGTPGILRVPQDAPTIQAAIDVAPNFFEIVLADGIYTGIDNKEILIYDKTVTIRGANGPDKYIIDLLGTGRAFSIDNYAPLDVGVRDLTISHGSTSGSGGAIRLVSGSVVCTDVRFIECGATIGGALAVEAGTTLITDRCTFERCFSPSGVAVHSSGTMSLFRSRFLACRSKSKEGGAIRTASATSALLVSGCEFIGQYPLLVSPPSLVGPIALISGGTAAFERSTGVGNRSGNTTYGTLDMSWSATVTVRDCILTGNPAAGPGAPLVVPPAPPSVLSFDHSLIQGWSGQFLAPGIVNADPRFVDVDGADNVLGTIDDNTHLLADSPCIKARWRTSAGLAARTSTEIRSYCNVVLTSVGTNRPTSTTATAT